MSVNLPELPIRNSEEFEVGNGKNYLHPTKSTTIFTRSVNILVRMVVCLEILGLQFLNLDTQLLLPLDFSVSG